MFLILAAGVLAFPTGWIARLQGLAIGFTLAYVLSIVRLFALHLILRHHPGAWEALHGLVLPLGPIIVISLRHPYPQAHMLLIENGFSFPMRDSHTDKIVLILDVFVCDIVIEEVTAHYPTSEGSSLNTQIKDARIESRRMRNL